MRMFGLVLAALALVAAPSAYASTDPIAQGIAVSIQSPTAAGSTTARSLSARFGDTINCADFGAYGDDTHDDTAALNACISAWKGLIPTPSVPRLPYLSTKLVIPKGIYKITGTGLNLTNIMGLGALFDLQGAILDCQMSGGVCVDALGSRWLNFNNFHEETLSTNVPAIGLQIGRTSASPADQLSFSGVTTIQGYFSEANMYNLASETLNVIHPIFVNYSVGATVHTLIQDGCNFWGASSAFVTETLTVSQCNSFDENNFIEGSFVLSPGSAGQSAIWTGYTSRLRFTSSWLSSPAGYGITIYSPAATPTYQLYADMHMEGASAGLADAFYIDGPASTAQANIFGLTYIEGVSFTTDAVFKVSSNVAQVHRADDFEVHVAVEDNAINMFSNPSVWQEFDGNVVIPLANLAWNPPANIFAGCATVLTTKTCSFNGALTASGGLAVTGATTTTTLVASTSIATPSFVGGTNNRLMFSGKSPGISSGFGTSAAMSSGSSGAGFDINVGTGGTATTGVVNMNATANAGWNCSINDRTSPTLPIWTKVTASSPTTVTVGAFNASGTASPWNASDVLEFVCVAK